MGGLQATNLAAHAHELAHNIYLFIYVCVGVYMLYTHSHLKNSGHFLSLSSAIISLCLRSPDTFLFLPLLTGHRMKARCIIEVIPYFIAKVTMDIGEQGPIRSIWSEEWKF